MTKPVYTDPNSQNYRRWLAENPEPRSYEVVMDTDERVIDIEEWLNEHCPGRFKMEPTLANLWVEESSRINIQYRDQYKIIFTNTDDFTQFSLIWL